MYGGSGRYGGLRSRKGGQRAESECYGQRFPRGAGPVGYEERGRPWEQGFTDDYEMFDDRIDEDDYACEEEEEEYSPDELEMLQQQFLEEQRQAAEKARRVQEMLLQKRRAGQRPPHRSAPSVRSPPPLQRHPAEAPQKGRHPDKEPSSHDGPGDHHAGECEDDALGQFLSPGEVSPRGDSEGGEHGHHGEHGEHGFVARQPAVHDDTLQRRTNLASLRARAAAKHTQHTPKAARVFAAAKRTLDDDAAERYKRHGAPMSEGRGHTFTDSLRSQRAAGHSIPSSHTPYDDHLHTRGMRQRHGMGGRGGRSGGRSGLMEHAGLSPEAEATMHALGLLGKDTGGMRGFGGGKGGHVEMPLPPGALSVFGEKEEGIFTQLRRRFGKMIIVFVFLAILTGRRVFKMLLDDYKGAGTATPL
eukprot:Sspe_Gene.80017::Locus_50314_Transcript_1_2_Confidence_0.667_Length_1327::g.80017::m.80017